MKKWIVLICIVAVLGGLYLTDYAVAKSYSFELVSATPDSFVADGYSQAKITVRLTRDGKPVGGHSINIVASNGTLPTSRMTTDEDGLITIRYYSYLYLNEKLTPLEDVVFTLEDESNSSIFLVPARGSFTFKVTEPEGESVWEDWQDIHIDEEVPQ